MDTAPDTPLPNDPPLVLRLDAPPAEALPPPPPAPRPRPGFWEAVLWCVALWVVQVVGFIAAAAVVVVIFALQSGNALAFIDKELGGTAQAVKPGGGTPIPRAMSEGFAWGFLFAQVAMLAFVLRVL